MEHKDRLTAEQQLAQVRSKYGTLYPELMTNTNYAQGFIAAEQYSSQHIVTIDQILAALEGQVQMGILSNVENPQAYLLGMLKAFRHFENQRGATAVEGGIQTVREKLDGPANLKDTIREVA